MEAFVSVIIQIYLPALSVNGAFPGYRNIPGVAGIQEAAVFDAVHGVPVL